MAYKRIVTQDGVTVMNKDLYDNLQDGIDESKQAVQDLDDNVKEQFKEVDTKLQDSGGIKFDGERDMIMIKNPFTGEWIDWQTTGKIILPSTITVNTDTLGGKQVTCSISGKTYTTEFSITSGTKGVAVFTVYEDGKALITCEEFKQMITVTSGGNFVSYLDDGVYFLNVGVLNNSNCFNQTSGDYTFGTVDGNYVCLEGDKAITLDCRVGKGNLLERFWIDCPSSNSIRFEFINDLSYLIKSCYVVGEMYTTPWEPLPVATGQYTVRKPINGYLDFVNNSFLSDIVSDIDKVRIIFDDDTPGNYGDVKIANIYMNNF